MSSETHWIDLSDERLEVRGLPWLGENSPDLWRLPGRAMGAVPERVSHLARFPGGGRIRLHSNTSQVSIRLQNRGMARLPSSYLGTQGFDAYADGVYWASVCAAGSDDLELTFFEGAAQESRQIDIYLPLFQECRVQAIGVDADAEFAASKAFRSETPIVYYGSSIAQGACTSRPGMTYQAILGRSLETDFVNLGFGGAGRAEPEVVELVSELDACGFVFDLGKSYGRQPKEVYAEMLERIRSDHPQVPLVCITPIFSTREFSSTEYVEMSEFIRLVMRQAALERIESGDCGVHLVEGLDLLGPGDADAFYEGTHPNAMGYTLMSQRLRPTLERALESGELK